MIPLGYRRTLMLAALGITLLVSVVYDSLFLQFYVALKLPLAAVIAACLGTTILLRPFPLNVVKRAVVANWPLHLFTIAFVSTAMFLHFGRKIDQVMIYTVFAYVLYLCVPLIFLLDRELFDDFVKMVAILSALLAIPSMVGAMGQDSLLGIPLRNKASYSAWSGIIASAGVFEHAEGHAFQMAIGVLCCMYLVRKYPGVSYFFWMGLCTVGLLISQGRAAIYGLGIAVVFQFTPRIFRYSRPIFFTVLIFLLTAPYFVLDQLATIPGLASYMRVERGLSGREEAWRFAIGVIERNPWKGYGFMASTEMTEDEQKQLRKSGFSGAGTTFHNTFITKAVDMGIVVTGIYALLYLVPLVRLSTPTDFPIEQDLVRNMALLTLTTSLYRDYNIGGIRSTALIGAIFYGLATIWPMIVLWRSPPTQVPAEPIAQPAIDAT